MFGDYRQSAIQQSKPNLVPSIISDSRPSVIEPQKPILAHQGIIEDSILSDVCNMHNAHNEKPELAQNIMQRDSETTTPQICIPREGKFRLCPHHSFSLDLPPWEYDTRDDEKPITYFTCQDCFPAIDAADGEAPGFYKGPEDSLVAAWKLSVCTITPGEDITKEHLRQGLRRLRAYSDLLCPHVSFDDDLLMIPFEWGNCVCINDPNRVGRSWDGHLGSWLWECLCCDCRTPRRWSNMGTIMEGDPHESRHQQKCFGCSAIYSWVMDGSRVLLSKRQHILDTSSSQVSEFRMKVEPVLEERSLALWAACLDLSTFRGNEATRAETFCHKARCSNSLPASLARWHNEMWVKRTLFYGTQVFNIMYSGFGLNLPVMITTNYVSGIPGDGRGRWTRAMDEGDGRQ
ncbi:hypothetical protein CMUS01_11189 [Colletotrichum musicola]|uniref:Uncharacterized protein n=1 Tax=Colletotrichum musicola TaxID=2175873 RepID=A0A8H6N7F3_9PEZI|nr:hypothetical protein CMUS01_11189 [Colletotrichum musicola]